MSGPFSGRVPEPDGPLAWWAVFTVVGLSAWFRILDQIVLLRWPRLGAAAFRVFVAGLRRSPYDEGSFDRRHQARRAGLSEAELRYGETPVVAARRVLRAAGVDSAATVLDLGAGRGRVLIAARSLDAAAIGVELLPEQAEPVRDALEAVGARIIVGDARRAPLEGVTHVWLTWTCTSEVHRRELAAHLMTAAPGTTICSVSWPLDGEEFELVQELPAWFTWGRSPVFVSRRRRESTLAANG